MTTQLVDTELRTLYRLNRSVPDLDGYRTILELEHKHFATRAAEIEANASHFTTRGDLFIANEANLEQFKEIVSQFAVDGMIESQSLLAIIPRLPGRSRMAVLRVLVDLEHHVARAEDGVLAFVGLFYWLAARAPEPDYFLGAYSYFESSVLYAFRSFAAASKRLGVRHDRYYTEHLYIDAFHSKQMQAAIRDLDVERGVDLRKVWTGVELTSAIVAEAVDAAVASARSVR